MPDRWEHTVSIGELVERAKDLNPEQELIFLENVLLGLTVGARMLYIKNPNPNDRLRIYVQINDINHHLLNRISALRGGDQFFTMEYTWHSVAGHSGGAPGLSALVVSLANAVLAKQGA
jgi:hypothetical protein